MVEESKGLGDTIHKITDALHIPHCRTCAERKEFLNSLVPYKRKVNMKEVPPEINGIRVRQYANGTFGIPRRNLAVEKYMDDKYLRTDKLRWTFKTEGSLELEALEPHVKGKKVLIVGKGPSLDYITKESLNIHDGLIICVNESIHKIKSLGVPNKLVSIQLDGKLQDSCYAEGCGILVAERAQNWYAGHKERYVFSMQQHSLGQSALGVICAISICKSLGVSSLEFWSFDASTDGSLDYATCIGYASSVGGKPSRFLNHGKQIEVACGYTKFKHVTPRLPESPSLDTPQESPDNPEEHREPETQHSVVSPATTESTSSTELSQSEMPLDHSDTEPQS
jgi:hypothetical protein